MSDPPRSSSPPHSFLLKLLLSEWVLTSWLFPLSLDLAFFSLLCVLPVLGDLVDFQIDNQSGF